MSQCTRPFPFYKEIAGKDHLYTWIAQTILTEGHLEGSIICISPLMMSHRKIFCLIRNGKSNTQFSFKILSSTSKRDVYFRSLSNMIFESVDNTQKKHFSFT